MSPTSSTNTRQKILIAVIGTSPAVLTETVWALTHQPDPWVPHQAIIITTVAGKDVARKQLIEEEGWRQLCTALEKEKLPVQNRLAFGASESIRVIGDGTRDFEDIQTPAESHAAADFILGVLRQYTEQPGTEIMVSIAGGRKTMSALMLACLSLLGRTQDRACHVLAEEDFLARTPGFLFPRSRVEQKAANLQLCEIPFVRVRGWYEKEYAGVPPSYMTLVNRFARIAPEPANYAVIQLNLKTGIVHAGETAVRLSPAEFSLLLILARRIKAGHLPQSWYDLEQDMNDLLARTDLPLTVDWFQQFKAGKAPDVEDFRKWASSARKKIRAALENPRLADMLIPSMKRKTEDVYPAEKIRIEDVSGRHKTK